MARKKQDWTPREPASARLRALAHWPRLQELARNHDGESRNQIRDILIKPFESKKKLLTQLDDVLWLVEGDHGYERLSFEIDPLWKEAWAAVEELGG